MSDTENLPTVTVNPLIEMMGKLAENPDMNPDNLKAMLDMQERILNRQEEHEYNAAMVTCQAAIPKVPKNKKGERGDYANLENVIGFAGPIWAEHGFALEFYEGDSPENMVRVTCDVRHIGGHVETRSLDMPLDTVGPKGEQNKTATQGTGSSFSYGKRYLSCGIFNIATGDDNNGAGPVAETLVIDEEQAAELDSLMEKIPENKQNRLWDWLNAMTPPIETFGQIKIAQFDFVKEQMEKTIADYLNE